MAGFQTANDDHLIRSELWSNQLKQLLLDDLMGTKYVKPITDFPDGALINIPSIGEAETRDFAEGQSVTYNKMDTGNFQFSFDQYTYSAHSISEKFKRDSFYSGDVLAAFVPRQHRALMERIEANILAKGPEAQTASNLNVINGGDHRWIGGGTGESMALEDFARARYSLTKANVPLSNLVAIVDPSVTFTLQTQANLVNALSPMPSYERIMREGLTTGTRFVFNIFGFDVYESNYLKTGVNETIDGKTSAAGVANLFFSAAPGDTLPLIGGFRQMPTVQSKFDMDTQEERYLTICEWGFKLYRPENMIVVITDTDVV
jgi:hypothetical protein